MDIPLLKPDEIPVNPNIVSLNDYHPNQTIVSFFKKETEILEKPKAKKSEKDKLEINFNH